MKPRKVDLIVVYMPSCDHTMINMWRQSCSFIKNVTVVATMYRVGWLDFIHLWSSSLYRLFYSEGIIWILQWSCYRYYEKPYRSYCASRYHCLYSFFFIRVIYIRISHRVSYSKFSQNWIGSYINKALYMLRHSV